MREKGKQVHIPACVGSLKVAKHRRLLTRLLGSSRDFFSRQVHFVGGWNWVIQREPQRSRIGFFYRIQETLARALQTASGL